MLRLARNVKASFHFTSVQVEVPIKNVGNVHYINISSVFIS
jgi:hypothetical protein